MKAKKVKYVCPSCNKKFSVEYRGWYPTATCIKCGKTAVYEDQLDGSKTLFIKKFKDVTAMVYDKKTGQPFWLDTKGRKIRHDSPEVRYDLYKDPHGWKATGKKVRETDKYGRKNV